MRFKVSGVDVATLGAEFGGVGGTTLGAGTGDGRVMEYLHWPNISWSYFIALSWALQVVLVVSVISHVRMDMAWMMQFSGVIEGCVKQKCWN